MTDLKSKKLFLLDMDGTIYLDNDVFDGTMDFLKKIKDTNNRYLFLTNNSSKSANDYVRNLKNIGIDAVENDFLTSTEATCVYIKNNYSNKKFYAFGTNSFVEELLSKGINVTTELSNDIDGIILSNDTELTFKKLDDTCRLLKNNDIIYIATNPDWVCPTSYGFVPDCG